MKKHTKSVGGEQVQGSSLWHIPRNKCGHGFPKGQLRGGWAAELNASPHMGRVGQYPQLGGHVFGGLAQGGPQLVITHGGSVDDQAGVVLATFGKAQGRHCRLPDKTQGRQPDQQATEQHVIPDIGKDSRAQDDLEEGQQPIAASPEAGMHLFDSMAVVQGEIQIMSGHGYFLSHLASASGEEAGAALASVALGPSWPLLPSIPGLWVGMVRSYSLLLRGGGLSAFTVARAESLSPTGRGPALWAPLFGADHLTIFWEEVGEAVFLELCLYQQGLVKAEALAVPVLVVVCSSVLNPLVNSQSVTFWLAAVAADLSKLALLHYLHRAVSGLLRDCLCPVDVVMDSAFYLTLSSTIPFGVSRSNKLTRSKGVYQFLPRVAMQYLAMIRLAWDEQFYNGLKTLANSHSPAFLRPQQHGLSSCRGRNV